MRSINISRLKESVLFTFKMSVALVYVVVLLSFIISFLILKTINFTTWLHTILTFSLVLLAVGGGMSMYQAGYWSRMVIYFKGLLRKMRQKQEEEVKDDEAKDSEEENSASIKERTVHVSTIVMAVSGGLLIVIYLSINLM